MTAASDIDTRSKNPVAQSDRVFGALTLAAAILVLLVLVGVFISLVMGAWPALQKFGPAFLWTKSWNPVTNKFGAIAPLYGTVVTSIVAMVIAVPVGLGVAIFLTDLCPRVLRRPLGIAIELLAGIPSIIYGIWGLFVFAPFMQSTIQPALIATLGKLPVIGALFAGPPYGIGLFTAGLILAMMILPFIASLSRDIFGTVPPMLREAAYGMGMTRWEVNRHIVIPHVRTALVGGIMLSLGRALGETMAVTFVIGNAHRISGSILAPGTTISAAIANEFNEATTPMYVSSLIALGLVLFILTFIVLACAQWMLRRMKAKAGV
ncbi:phosphate ABC transporter permease [Thioclava dalianensis]|uniref:Phosphate transport system permease protein n=1 Tax=Thioclava dalianensis TaxID=1185766 RepID=A0A074TFR2_9RHOB|nr:phosphate ABC transporter permease subunit PstC [Thioclava dalianensis]KEP70509.1 phosphate ABC transporter permease [Thioclava dalianensis]SFN08542.1 phosphate transport system permease protein [Thioclava dalianensis]